MAVLAVDGGQSGIRLRHSEVDRVVEVAGVSHQSGDTVDAVAEAIAEGWHQGGFPSVDLAVLGLSTAPSDPVEADRLCARIGAVIGSPQVWLADDAVTAHAGAFALRWGVSITVGTGVACLARGRTGPATIIGGHGFLLGDEGGAFWIGREGIRAALRARDGRGPATRLTTDAAIALGPLEDLHIRLHAGDRPVDVIARFAPVVIEAAQAGDVVADTIVDAAATELALLAAAAVAIAAPDDGSTVPVALGGRLLSTSDGGHSDLRRRIDARLQTTALAFDLRDAAGSPLDGALALGRSGDPGAYAPLIHAWRARVPA